MNANLRSTLVRLTALLVLMAFLPSGVGRAQAPSAPGPATPFDGGAAPSAPSPRVGNVHAPKTPAIGDAFKAGADRLTAEQNGDGGWGWPLTGTSATNIVGPSGKSLALAYGHTSSASHRAALVKAGTYLTSAAKVNKFSPSDGYLAAQLDSIFGGTTYRDYMILHYYGALAAGTYQRNGTGPSYTTASYVDFIRTSRSGDQANMAAWDLGLGLVGAAAAGADTGPWITGVKAEINELDGANYYDVIGLAGAVYGLAYVGEDFDPTAGQHAAASSLAGLGNILASYQLPSGGFTWNSGYLTAGNETNQETAYAILALNQLNRDAYLTSVLVPAGDYLQGVRLGTGGWNDYVGDPDENNEITGEALWGIAAAYPVSDVWVCPSGDCGHPEASFNVIQNGVNAVSTGGTVHVAAGTYSEQVTVDKNLHLVGAGVGSTILQAPGSLPPSGPTSVILMIAGSGVSAEVNGFTVAGPGPSGCGSIAAGIFVRDGANGIAREWYLAISSISSLIPDRAAAIRQFSELAERIIAFLTDPMQPEAEARSIGEALGEMHCIQPGAIEATWDLWTRQVTGPAQASELAVVYPRLISLMRALTSGYLDKTREIALAEQEQIRQALVLHVENVSHELREHELHLEEIIRERTRELQASTEQYRMITTTSMLGIFQVDASGVFVFLNQAFCKMVGYAHEELIGRSFKKLINPDDLPEMLAGKKLLQAGGTLSMHRVWTHKAGRPIYTVTRVAWTQTGDEERYTAFVANISDQRQMEEALRHSEVTLRALIDNTADTIWSIDAEYRLTSTNAAFREAITAFLGREPSNGESVFKGIPQAIVDEWAPLYARALAGEAFASVNIAPGGLRGSLYRETSFNPIFGENDKVAGVACFSRDITGEMEAADALRASEERYRTLAESAQHLILTFDREHQIIYVNSFAAGYIGLRPNELAGKPSSFFFSQQFNRVFEAAIDAVFQSGNPVRLDEQRPFKSGVEWLGFSAFPLRDADGNVASVLVLAKDISELKHSQHALLLAKNQLERRVLQRTASLAASQKRSRELARHVITAQEDERRRLARELHDESGQALISLRYEMASVLKDLPKESKPTRRGITKLMASVDQAVQHLREISQDLRPPILDVAGIHLSLKEYCAELAKKTSLSIRYEGDELPRVDAEIAIGLFRIVQELLANVVRHARATTAAVSLRRDKDMIVLVVRDNGRGIRKKSSNKGVGLLGIQERLDILGGTMKVHSLSGGGAKITVSIAWKELKD